MKQQKSHKNFIIMVSPNLALQTKNLISKTDNHKALKFISGTLGTLQWSLQQNLQGRR